jgi:hypothetical protein
MVIGGLPSPSKGKQVQSLILNQYLNWHALPHELVHATRQRDTLVDGV